MKSIGEINETVMSKDIIYAMEQKYAWKQTTILTLLARLVKKGFLESNKTDKYTYYTIIVGEEYKDFETKLFCENIYDDSVKNFFALLINNKTISKEKIEFFKELFNYDEDE